MRKDVAVIDLFLKKTISERFQRLLFVYYARIYYLGAIFTGGKAMLALQIKKMICCRCLFPLPGSSNACVVRGSLSAHRKRGEALDDAFLKGLSRHQLPPVHLRLLLRTLDLIMNFILAGRDTTACALSWYTCLFDSITSFLHQILRITLKIMINMYVCIGNMISIDKQNCLNFLFFFFLFFFVNNRSF